LVGYNPKMLENDKKMISKHPLVEKAEEMKDKIENEVSNNKLVKKAEKMSSKLKKNITETIEDVKEKIEDYKGDITKDVKGKVENVTNTKSKNTTQKKAAPKKKAVVEEVAVEKIVIEKTAIKNNLKVIKGIGPVLEKSLNELGITAFNQIANITIKDLTKVLNDEGINAKIYDLSGWNAQAELALKEDKKVVEK
jgi:predicted flap endonuclease-1-like 5' DNA nuclease